MAFVYPQRSGLIDAQRSGSVLDCLLWSPEDVTIRFLEAVAVADPDVAERLLAPDVSFRFGTSRLRRRRDGVRRRLQRLGRSRWGYDVVVHEVSRYESTVWIDRTDAFDRGRLRIQVGVRGVVQVADGKITVWSDTVRWVDFAVATVRGLIGTMVPSIRAQMPLESAR